MEKPERPFPLVLLMAIYFVIGSLALFHALRGEQSDLFSLSFLLIAYGTINRKFWALVGLKTVAVVQALFATFVTFLNFLPGKSTAFIGFGGLEFDVDPFVAQLLLFVYIGGQCYVAFSNDTFRYITALNKPIKGRA